ncbi:MAG: aspartate-semialdehyde dehydrogenase [Candidatus Edwardsbacteria bacterium]|jgi:aspartate-semialdehyde dehydrogenase|nr:aspartate-semialdehyde dehydrogenase [Candidatus Edwardsbacteria bacterium]
MTGKTVGLVGATGLVGQALLAVLRQRRFPVAGLRLWASARSRGRTIRFAGRPYTVADLARPDFAGCDIVFFAGTEGEQGASVRFAPAAAAAGAVVIDNGADFRMDPAVPLVVPEVNPCDVLRHRGIIANPNCSTIQMVVALAPIHRVFGLKRIVVATYQSVSGAGRGGVEALRAEMQNAKRTTQQSPFGRRIAGNVIPQIGGFSELGYSGEEWKMVRETRKIFHDESIAVNATTVRVPVAAGHSESVYFETQRPATVRGIEKLLRRASGVAYSNDSYHTPLEIAGKDDVFVSRLRPDPSTPDAFALWVVADNLRKGAATNAVQIAEQLL